MPGDQSTQSSPVGSSFSFRNLGIKKDQEEERVISILPFEKLTEQ